jgi:integrase
MTRQLPTSTKPSRSLTMKHGGGIKASIGCHTFRATGITAYLKNKGTLETAQQLANHESPRTTKL